jgi:tetratricopeptide (TPR) repeat protein
VYGDRGDEDRMLQCLDEAESLARDLGDREEEARIMLHQARSHADRGEYDIAMQLYARGESLARELGDPRLLWTFIGNRGRVHRVLRQYDQALECYVNAIAEHRAIDYRDGLVSWLGGAAETILDLLAIETQMPTYLLRYLPELSHETEQTWRRAVVQWAHTMIDECIAIAGELSNAAMVFAANVALARLDAVDGHVDQAVERLRGMFDEQVDDPRRAELHYWLWRTPPQPTPLEKRRAGEGFQGEERSEYHRAEAERIYTELLASTPTHEYKQRLEELQAGTE